MENIQKTLQGKGFIGRDGKSDINALNRLSVLTTMNFVCELRDYIAVEDEETKMLSDIHSLLAVLYNTDKTDEAVKFLNVLATVSGVELPEDVQAVFSCDITKRDYLYEFLADFHEIVEDFRMEAGLENYEDGEMQTIECCSAVPSF